MKTRAFPYLIGLMVLPLAVSLACGSPAPTAEPTQPPPTEVPVAADAPSGDEWLTFTDENDYLEFDLPGDWDYGQDRDAANDNWYWDIFRSPDGHAGIESIVYDEGKVLNTGKTALSWLHQFYSSTGKEGDIRISDDSIQKDGSERLTWRSKGANRSGISFFETRRPTAMLMFTVWWDDDYKEQYGDILDDVISSYRVP
jgi:hypothetical protein